MRPIMDPYLRTKDHLRKKDWGWGSWTIPWIFRFRGTFDISNPLTAEYPKNTAWTAVNATQIGDGSWMPWPFVQNGDAWMVIGWGGKVWPTGKPTTDGNMIIAIIDNATNLDADWIILEESEQDIIALTQAQALVEIGNSSLIPWFFYQITDRYNMVIQALDTDTFWMSCEFIVPALAFFNVTDEVVTGEYDLPTDTVFTYRDIRNNSFFTDQIGITWAVFIGTTLPWHRFWDTLKTNNEYSVWASFSLFTWILDNNRLRGSFSVSGGWYINQLVAEQSTSIGGPFDWTWQIGNIEGGSTINFTGVNTGTIIILNASNWYNYAFTDFTGTLFFFSGIDWGTSAINGWWFLLGNTAIRGSSTYANSTLFSNNFVNAWLWVTTGATLSSCDFNNSTMNLTSQTLISCSFDHALINMDFWFLSNCQIDYYPFFNSMSGYVASYKRYNMWYSNFEQLIDISGSTNVNLTGFEYAWIINLQSGNPTETLTTATQNQSLNPVEYRPNSWLVVTFNFVPVAGALVDEFVHEVAVNIPVDWTNRDWISYRKELVVWYNQKVGGAVYA